MISSHKLLFLLISFLLFLPAISHSQVELRDSLLSWQHHQFTLNADYGMQSYSTVDTDIETVQFNAKVIENELIRLVLVPEYGGRIISFFYKPTGHEYLYQSECGSPYGINEGNFYYNWLMVYGGIFPTFPEPEHGKTWLLAWDYSVVKNTSDTVIVHMEYTDNSSFSGAPGSFNNGVTDISCLIEVGVYAGTSIWDFKVSLTNPKNETVNYEYWTCTALTPGSDIGDTGNPLTSEMLVPIDQYRAAWSPESWIGSYGSLYSFENIDHLSDWDDMGIAYAHNLSDNYWGVINHENKEGIFRISENIETFGMKFWTWGKNNVDNNLLDFSNGGKDNYIELWAGVSGSFFTDAYLSPYQEINWTESYGPTVNMNSITKINRDIAVNMEWDQASKILKYELFAFVPELDYRVNLNLTGDNNYSIVDEVFLADVLGNTDEFTLDYVSDGNYTAVLDVYDNDDVLIITAEKDFSISSTSLEYLTNNDDNLMTVAAKGNNMLQISLPDSENYRLKVYNLTGQLVEQRNFYGTSIDLTLPSVGLYIISVTGEQSLYTKKAVVN